MLLVVFGDLIQYHHQVPNTLIRSASFSSAKLSLSFSPSLQAKHIHSICGYYYRITTITSITELKSSRTTFHYMAVYIKCLYVYMYIIYILFISYIIVTMWATAKNWVFLRRCQFLRIALLFFHFFLLFIFSFSLKKISKCFRSNYRFFPNWNFLFTHPNTQYTFIYTYITSKLFVCVCCLPSIASLPLSTVFIVQCLHTI